MRGNTLVILLSLAILAGSPMSAQAANVGPDNNGTGGFSAGRGGGGGGGGDDGPNDPGNNNEGEGLVDCIITSRPCIPPPPPPPQVKKKANLNKAVNDDDCTCRPYPLKVNNQTQIVLDCYESKIINGVERTRYCKQRPEIYNIQ